eukprot:TRINITY_DN79272_c0_g1_i1.p1 TRINITY_DN79272_c0_g1~~TRINITY_DN79272_c0_g1_i1.p1  ORF type:complete len:142 (-),score=34.50 TRINITY_DN79272_c0_g1_i1:182-607(-)
MARGFVVDDFLSADHEYQTSSGSAEFPMDEKDLEELKVYASELRARHEVLIHQIMQQKEELQVIDNKLIYIAKVFNFHFKTRLRQRSRAPKNVVATTCNSDNKQEEEKAATTTTKPDDVTSTVGVKKAGQRKSTRKTRSSC